jgi:protein required for attachment to host cells
MSGSVQASCSAAFAVLLWAASGGADNQVHRSVHTGPKDVEKEHFARSLGQMLDQAMRSARFQRWVLAAPPHVLGLMGKELTPVLKKHLLVTVNHDLNHLDARELAERLVDTVRIPPDE